MLRDGDYVPDGLGGFERVDGAEELLQRVLWKLMVRRGSFPFFPRLGSRLYCLLRETPARRAALARQYVAEALADEEQLEVSGVTVQDWGDGCDLTVRLNWKGEALSAQVTI